MTDEDRPDPGSEPSNPDQPSAGNVSAHENKEPIGAGVIEAHPEKAIEPAAQATPPPVQAPSPKPAASRIFLYAVIGGVIGVLLVIGFAAMNLNQNKAAAPESTAPPEITVAPELNVPHLPRDLGLAYADAQGLKAHLITIWNGKLAFRLNIEPSDPALLPGFAQAVANSPKPLSIAINFKTSSGQFLCSQNILLKFIPHLSDALPPLVNGKPPKKGSQEAIDFESRQQAELGRSQVQEQERERGNEVFQNDLDQDGQLKSISVEGDTQCPPGTYDTVAFWSLSTNFPSLGEQAELHASPADLQETATGSSPQQSGAYNNAAAHRRAKYTAAPKAGSFSMEGGDSIVEYDANAGIIETAGGKTFFTDKSGGEGNAAGWQDYRAGFQYKCDQNAACTLTRAGAGVLHARLKQ